MAVVFAVLMILGCLLISVCITVLTFTAVEMRRSLARLTATINEMGDRNYAAIMHLQKWQRRSDVENDPEPPGEVTVRKVRES